MPPKSRSSDSLERAFADNGLTDDAFAKMLAETLALTPPEKRGPLLKIWAVTKKQMELPAPTNPQDEAMALLRSIVLPGPSASPASAQGPTIENFSPPLPDYNDDIDDDDLAML